MIGTTLGNRYHVETKLLSDKLGTSFRGRRLADGLSVHLLAFDQGVKPTSEQLDEVLAVSRAVAQLEHPSVVPAIDWVQEGEGPVCIVSPLMDGIPLADFAKGGTAIPDALDITWQIAGALDATGKAGFGCKDLSANNVMVSVLADGGQVVRILRWGFDALMPEFSLATKDGPFYGTPEYMAPEICSGKGWLASSDMYSLGIIAYHLVTGKAPFISSNPATTLKRQIYEKPLPLHLLKRGVPLIGDFEKLVLQMLQKMPAKRPESPEALVVLLEEFRSNLLPTAEFTSQRPRQWPEVNRGGAVAAEPTAAAPTEGANQTLTFRGMSDVGAMEAAGDMALDEEAEGADTLRMGEEEARAVQSEVQAIDQEQTQAFKPSQTLAFDVSAVREKTPEPQEKPVEIVQPSISMDIPEEPTPEPSKPAEAAPVDEPVRKEATRTESAGKASKKEGKSGKSGKGAREAKETKAVPEAREAKAEPAQPGVQQARSKFLAEAQKQLEETDEEDWFVESAQELEGREITHITESWSEKKSSQTGWKFYAIVGGVGLVLLVAIGVLLSKMDSEKKPAVKSQQQMEAERREAERTVQSQETEKEKRLKEAAEAESRRAFAEQKKADEALMKAEQEKLAKEEAVREQARKDEERKLREKLQEEERLAAGKEAQVLVAEQAALQIDMKNYRGRLEEKAVQWKEANASAAASEVAGMLDKLGRMEGQLTEVTIDPVGGNLKLVLPLMQSLRAQMDQFKVDVEPILGRTAEEAQLLEKDAAARAAAEEEARKAAEAEELARKAQEEKTAQEADEAARLKAAADEEAARKAQAEADAQAKAEEAAARKAQQDAARKAALDAQRTATGTQKAQQLVARGDQSLKAGRHDQAIALYRQAKTANPAGAAEYDAMIVEAQTQKAHALEARKAQTDEAARKKAEEAAAKKKAAEEAAAKKKAADEAEKKKVVAQGGAERSADLQTQGTKALKDGKYDQAISLFEQARTADPSRAAVLDRLIAKARSDKAAAGASDDEAKKKAEEEAAARKAAQEEEKKRKQEVAAAKKAEEDAARKKEADEAAKKKADEEAAKKKAADEAAKKKEAAAEKTTDEAKAQRFQKLGMEAMKAGNYALAIKYFEKARQFTDKPEMLDRLIKRCQDQQQ